MNVQVSFLNKTFKLNLKYYDLALCGHHDGKMAALPLILGMMKYLTNHIVKTLSLKIRVWLDNLVQDNNIYYLNPALYEALYTF